MVGGRGERRVVPGRLAPLAAFTSALPDKSPEQLTVAVAGATGYIGKAVVRECVRRGYKTKAYVREESMERARTLGYLKGAEVRAYIAL